MLAELCDYLVAHRGEDGSWGSTPQDFLQGKTAMMWTATGNLTNVKNNAKFDFGVAMLLAEEIVGEIHDVYDVNEEPEIERESNQRFWVNGRVTLDDLSVALGVALDREEVSTVGGLIYAELGRVPRPGEELRIAGFRVVVERVVRRRIHRVYFERQETAIAEASPFALDGDA